MMIEVRAKPSSKEEYVKKLSDEVYEVAVKEPAEKGRANNRITKLLSEHFRIPRRSVVLVRGKTSKIKLFQVDI
ncbi:MAG: DUF167 domain-containing protein [Aquificaceae bacterium]